ncbi:MAG TPA: hypothetical protein VKW08_04010 [Xanthobacteraceae bacterium]|nr:hypothetical protein [Xanthobacteraceae bacterium]
MSELRRLPNQFPDGTRFVIEGRAGRVLARYVEFPDGRHIDLATNHAGIQEPGRVRRRFRKAGARAAAK